MGADYGMLLARTDSDVPKHAGISWFAFPLDQPGVTIRPLVEIILLILGTASAAAWALTQTGFAQYLAVVMKELPGGWIVFMAVTIVTFLLLGCLLEGLPAIVLLAPLMFPIAKDLGIHPVHYAMVVVVAMNIGLFAPPVGIGHYIACSIGKVDPDAAMKTVWFYLGARGLGLVAIALVPAISIGLL